MEMKVLVVDDEPLICESIRADFARMDHLWSYEIFTASSVVTAEEIYYREEIDVLITDINMPGGSGLLLISEMHEYNPHCVILVLSAYDDFSYVRNAFTMGASDYLLKPIAFSELESCIRKLVERTIGQDEKKVLQEEPKIIFTIEDVVVYIGQHVGERLSAAEMAKKMAVSYRNFGKIFKLHTGMTFSAYLLWYRMECAKEYLVNSHMKIKQVAYKVGYRESPQHFSRDFTRQVGMSPKEYRTQLFREDFGG